LRSLQRARASLVRCVARHATARGAARPPLRQLAPGAFALINAIAVAINADTSVMLPGTIIVLFFCASWLYASTARSATLS